MTSEVQTTTTTAKLRQQRRARPELSSSKSSTRSCSNQQQQQQQQCNNITNSINSNNNNTSNLNMTTSKRTPLRQTQQQDTSAAAEQVPGHRGSTDSQLAPEEGEQVVGRPHHVGPVMGIFFKVWSLVKVTKVRHNQKLRRQNSEEAAQFQYIAGDQLVSGSQPRMLEDAHFRRAGSQPAPSTSSRSGRCEPLTGNHAHRLQLALPAAAAATSSATNSTSSGVSSGTAGSSHGFRPTTPSSVVSSRVPSSAVASVGAAKPASSGWASKIKRSATTVNQSDLSTYVSRYRNRRDRNHSVGPNASPMPEVAARGALSSSARSFDDHQSEVLPAASDAEEDSNDIYSTPNDSIQSVPGTAPLLTAHLQQVAAAGGDAGYGNASTCFPITKSFSTSNFGQLVKQQRRGSQSSNATTTNHSGSSNNNTNNNNRFESIDETTTTVGSRDLQRQDSVQSNEGSPAGIAKQRSGSRFFISSSSSEDSTSPNQPHQQQQRRQTQQPLANQPQPASTESQQVPLELCRRQVPVQHGVHYHNLALMRPDSLLYAPPEANFLLPVSLFTPTGAHLTAAMSPQELSGGARFTYLRPSYRKSPSLFEISARARAAPGGVSRFSSKYPTPSALTKRTPRPSISSFKPPVAPPGGDSCENLSARGRCSVPNSISLQDCKLSSQLRHQPLPAADQVRALAANYDEQQQEAISEYKLAQMLLESGNNPNAKDSEGYTALMHAVLSDNVPAIKCLLEHRVNPNETNNTSNTALDLICSKPATGSRLEILKLLIDNKADVDKTREGDGSRLLDRLIGQHHRLSLDKLPYIDCLLQNGAKLGSSTWNAAAGKEEVQIRLLRKLCQDGYYLYKKSSIEAAVYRFEYALKRIAQLEQQLSGNSCLGNTALSNTLSTHLEARQIKYQTYLGLSRCERKRRFFKRAIEFAHMAILVDSTSYEGYYSKAHILKDLGEIDDSIIAIDQTSRLVEKSIEAINMELNCLQQEEALLFENCYNLLDQKQQQQQQQSSSSWIESNRCELISNLEYMQDAMKYISRLKAEILDEKLRESSHESETFSTDPIAA